MTELSLHFPADAVNCQKGNYLLFNNSLYYVEDIVQVQPLVPVASDRSVLLVKDSFSDSAVSDHHGEIYLLLSSFNASYKDEVSARNAVREQSLQVKETGLLRPARMFPKDSCIVIS
jgi:hypothetical protein